MTTGIYEISLLMLKNISWVSAAKFCISSVKEKLCISGWPGNILFIYSAFFCRNFPQFI